MSHRRAFSPRRTGAVFCLLLGIGTRVSGAEPVVQKSPSIGAEIEGILQCSSQTKLSEKAEYIHDPTISYGLPAITYELDQIDGTNAKSATVEIVTAPYINSEKGITKLLTAVQGAVDNAPPKARFLPSADFGGSEAECKISKMNVAGAPQINVTIPAFRLMVNSDDLARTRWGLLTDTDGVNKIVPLLGGAREIVALLSEEGKPLAAWEDQKHALRLWIFMWLSRVSFEIEDSPGMGGTGYHKDRHGLTIKLRLGPVASGLPPEVATAWENVISAAGPLALQITDIAKRSVTASLGKSASDVRTAWDRVNVTLASTKTGNLLGYATSTQPLATERPLDIRMIDGMLAPVIELRRTGSTINAAFRTAVSNILIKKMPIAPEARTFFSIVEPLL